MARIIAMFTEKASAQQSCEECSDSICKRFLTFSPRHLGSIPFDEVVTRSIMKQTLLVRLYPESGAVAKINQIANAMVG
jgi:MinD-like ATPase involved in chromosome partitioning or flagellar assembly